ncbi:MAG: hypothetical protein NTZ21_09530 [Actinobacteria bacterium]|nr:hypothetical protein [Actinomycetota bacterium]
MGVLVLSGLLVACGGDSTSGSTEDAGGEASDPTTTLVAAEVTAPEPEATTPETAPATTAAATVPATEPATDPGASGLDECLVGSWIMKQDTLDLFLASAVPFAGISVPSGAYTYLFGADGTVVADAKFTAQFNMGDTPAEADIFWLHKGTWSTADGVLSIDITEQEAGMTEMRQGGFAVPGAPMEPITPVAGGPYTCDQTSFDLTIASPGGELLATFER